MKRIKAREEREKLQKDDTDDKHMKRIKARDEMKKPKKDDTDGKSIYLDGVAHDNPRLWGLPV